MADADHALAYLERAVLVGRGLGAYVALLVGGARPDVVRGAVLAAGPGLAGAAHRGAGLARPGDAPVGARDHASDDARGSTVAANGSGADPRAWQELSDDLRPAPYALGFARRLLATGVPPRLAVAVPPEDRPPWLAGVAAEPGVICVPVAEALGLMAPA